MNIDSFCEIFPEFVRYEEVLFLVTQTQKKRIY